MEKIISLLELTIKTMVTQPDSVEINSTEEKDEAGELLVLNVKVHQSDVSACIGKGGMTAECIRRIIGIAGWTQTQKRVYVKIDAPKFSQSRY